MNWAGFYVLDHGSVSSPTARSSQTISQSSSQRQLILGPFQGKVACQTISWGKGVCGTAAQTAQTQLVHDVESFPGHIACDGDSRSEIVVPIIIHGNGSGEDDLDGRGDLGDGNQQNIRGKVVGVIDIDCAEIGGFDDVDREWLEKVAELLAHGCHWGI